MDIHPTHTCFDDALDYLTASIREDLARGRQLVLVHAICLSNYGPAADTPIAHAWVEDPDGLCWTTGYVNGERGVIGLPRDEFYAQGRVQLAVRYTVAEVLEQNQRHGTYGPWRPEILVLCVDTVPGEQQPEGA